MDFEPSSGTLVGFRSFDDASREAAERSRIELELAHLHAGIDREVVILEAASETDLRRTHWRYFETLEQLASTPGM